MRFVLVALLLAGCAQFSANTSTSTDFLLRDLDGRDVRLSDYAGQIVLIAFMASWSRPSQAELPHLERLYRAYHDRGFVVLGIAIDGPETVATVPAIAHRYEISFPILCDNETKVVAIYNPKRSTPLWVLMDRGGAIVKIREGYNTGDEKWLEAEVRRLLGGI